MNKQMKIDAKNATRIHVILSNKMITEVDRVAKQMADDTGLAATRSDVVRRAIGAYLERQQTRGEK